MKKRPSPQIRPSSSSRKRSGRTPDALPPSERSFSSVLCSAGARLWEFDLIQNRMKWLGDSDNSVDFPAQGFPEDFPSFLARIHPEDRGAVETAFTKNSKGRKLDLVFRLPGPAGEMHRYRVIGGTNKGVALHLLSGLLIEETSENRTIEYTEELERAKERAESAMQRAEAASHAKTEFLANMSHEIRTPMNGVLGMVELLLETELTEQQRALAGTLLDSARSMLLILNDILDISRIASGKITLVHSPFDLHEVLHGVISIFEANARQKGIETFIRISPQIPIYVNGDSSKFRQILTNLVNNAVKFTDRGYVLIEATPVATRTDEAANSSGRTKIRIAVKDSGIGIHHDHLQRIFEPFVQADNSTTRRFGGTGLGLAICKRLLKLMGSELEVRSECGIGSEFFFEIEFPIESIEAEIAKPMPPTHTLIVSAHRIRRESIREWLEYWQVPCHEADTHDQAHAIMESKHVAGEPVSIIIQDLEPGSDPLLKTYPDSLSAHDVSVIYLTPASLLDHKHKLFDFGAVSVIAKPFLPSDLQGAIRRCAETWSRLRDSRPDTPDDGDRSELPHQQTNDDSPFDPLHRIEALLVEDNEVNQTVSVRMLQRLGCRVSVAEHGKRALELIARQRFDIIFMDCRMPVMDGFEATKQIRQLQEPAVAAVPIVAMTAYAMDSDRTKCLEAGMNDYLSKPLSVKIFQNAIRRNCKFSVSKTEGSNLIERD